MLTGSYLIHQEYVDWVESNLNPKITPSTSVEVPIIEPAPELLNSESGKKNIAELFPDLYEYKNNHVAQRESGSLEETGWTEKEHADDAKAGGMVRTALLSGSYAEFKKVRVDSEVNSETITTSWSASIGENLRVGNNAGIAGYMVLGDTASLKTGSSQPGQDPTHSFASSSENVPDLRLVVSDSALIQKDLYVKENASVSGNLDVFGNTGISGTLNVSGNTDLHSNLTVDHSASVLDLYVTNSARIGGDLEVTGSEIVSGNLTVEGNTDITGALRVVSGTFLSGNLQVVGNEAVTGSLHVSSSIYGSENLYLTGDLYTSGNLNVDGKSYLSGNTEISSALFVHGTSSFSGATDYYSDAYFRENVLIRGDLTVQGSASYLDTDQLYVKDYSITIACGSANPEQADGAGIDIDGAGVTFHYTSSTDRMGLNKGLDVLGDENVTGSLYVSGSIYGSENFYLSGNAQISGNLDVTGDMNLDSDTFIMSGASIISGTMNVDNSVNTTNLSASNNTSTKNLYVENNVEVGNSASIEKYLEVGGDGNGASVVVQTGSIEAYNSDLYIQNITGSGNLFMSGIISGAFLEGDGRNLVNVTASIASSSTWKSYLDFEASSSQTLMHPFKTTDVFVQVYQWANSEYHPDTASMSSFDSPAIVVSDAIVKIIDSESVEISYPQALNGYAIISDAGMLITASVDILQCATDIATYTNVEAKKIYRFPHKLGTKNVIVAVYEYVEPKYTGRPSDEDILPVQILPEQIAIPDKSHVDIVFGREGISGYIVIAKAGHVVKESEIAWNDFITEWNVHYGTEGDWWANSFNSETASANLVAANVVSVGDYIDTVRIGNRDQGYQYYEGLSWGSYLEFTDTGIDAFVRNTAESDEDVWQVANINKNGDLTIRGDLITNGTFSTSDLRKKENVQTLKNALEDIKAIRGVSFNWKESGEPGIGVIAQEIKTIYPELTKVVTNINNEEQLVVNYDGLVGVLIEAVKSLSKKVEQLEIQINENR